ncbi:YajG family lipoprotein [Salinicola salarius]|uniref:YajG family lipoprotein n=1 Tax=Salinicola salarius TaxID=430457 RepID=UPI000B3F7291|nr:YajG family lipoprotein [Salinicola salarius]
MKAFRILVLVAGLALLHGCGAIPETEKLVYEPQTDVAPIQGADGVTVNVDVVDDREDKSRISSKKYSYGGFEMASIHSEEPVENVVQSAIEQELQARGFVVDADAPLTIHGDIEKLYSELHLIDTFWTGKAVGDSQIDFVIGSKDGETLFSRVISVQPEYKGLMYQSGENLARPVELAIEETMDQLFADPAFIDALLNQ